MEWWTGPEECSAEGGGYQRNTRCVGEVRRGGKARTRNEPPFRNIPNGCVVASFDGFPLLFCFVRLLLTVKDFL